MPETDADLVHQLRAWADDLADQVGPVEVPAPRSPRRPRLLAVAAAILVLAVGVVAVRAATTDDGETTVAGPSTTADAPVTGAAAEALLVDGTWSLVEAQRGGELVPIPDDVEASVLFRRQEERLFFGADDGCNSGGGTATISGDRVSVSEYIQTLAGCVGDRGRLSGVVGDVVREAFRFRIEGDRLVLAEDDDVLTFERGPSVGLGDEVYDVTWRLVSVEDGGETLVEVVGEGDAPSSLRFHRQGECDGDGCADGPVVNGTVACNSFGGPITQTDDGFRANGLSATEAGCVDPAADAFIAVVRGAPRVELAGDRLVLREDDVVVTMERGDDFAPTDLEVVAIGDDPAYRVTAEPGEGGRLVRITAQAAASGGDLVSERYAVDGVAQRGGAVHVVPLDGVFLVVGVTLPDATVTVLDEGRAVDVATHPIEGVPGLVAVAGVLADPPTSGCRVSTTTSGGALLGSVPC